MRAIRVLARFCLLFAMAVALYDDALSQMRPPTFSTVMPYGAKRGTTANFTIEGTNLGQADHVLFDDANITGKILTNEDLGVDKLMRSPASTAAPIEDRASKNKLTIEVIIGPDARLGRHSFRIKTPLGTSNAGTIVVGAVKEADETEPNNSVEASQKISLPTCINGFVGTGNDADHYTFEARAGQCLVFEVMASAIGSSLDSTLSLIDPAGRIIASNEDFNKSADSVLGFTFATAGKYSIRVTDSLGGGSRRHFYRLTVGELPYVTGIFPLGVRKEGGEVSLSGFNLNADQVKIAPRDSNAEFVPVPISVGSSAPLNSVRAALGKYREELEKEPNNELATATLIGFPITINGRIGKNKDGADRDVFRFRAKKGQQIVFNVMAQRLGSGLDSFIEVLDERGNAVPRATLRPTWQTFVTLNDPNSQQQGLRLESWSGLAPGDFVLVGRELIQVADLPKHPDADVVFKGFRGRRLGFEGTTPHGHSMNTPVYRVEIHRPGAVVASNGMPTFSLFYRNDDGGPTHGKDSQLTFVAPEDGRYYLRISDVLGHGDESFTYRLTAAEPKPDFSLSVSPANPNVPVGGRVPITVTANRIDGFDGKIDIRVVDLPVGLSAAEAVILPGQTSITLTLSASERATMTQEAGLKVTGTAVVNGSAVVRNAESGSGVSVISLASSPDLYISSVTPEVVEVEPGGRAKVTVKIRRANGFAGRVPLSVQNLPFLLSVPDIGLNGILITEAEESRDFYIVAEPTAEPSEQTIFVTGRVETNSPLSSDHASVPIKLRVAPGKTAGTK
jgi:hypothetical protein